MMSYCILKGHTNFDIKPCHQLKVVNFIILDIEHIIAAFAINIKICFWKDTFKSWSDV